MSDVMTELRESVAAAGLPESERALWDANVQLAEQLRAVRAEIKTLREDQDERIENAVAARVANLFKGQWTEGMMYERGSFVVHGGSTWCALIDSKAVRPGDGSCWQLCAKRGRDAR
jgi:hypothetical protein